MFNSQQIEQAVKDLQADKNQDENCRLLYPHLRRIIWRVFRGKNILPQECDELTQDAIFRVFTHIKTFRHKSSFYRWVLQIVGNVYIDYIRRQTAGKRDRETRSLDSDGDEEGNPMDVADPSQQFQPEAVALNNENWQLFTDELMKLPAQQRNCMFFYEVQGLSVEEIAKAMGGISVNTVKSHLKAARKNLTARLGEHFGKSNRRETGS